MLIIGHRGAMAYEPENTLASFELAIVQGADMLELDIFALPSGELMVFHDRVLQRTTNGHGLLLHHSFRELRKLDAGKGQRIPTLQEVLDLVDRRVPIVVELKHTAAIRPLADMIAQYTSQRGWSTDDFVVSSFHHPAVRDFKRLMPDIRVVAATAHVPLDYAAFAAGLSAYAITPDIEALDRDFVNDAHERGLLVFAYTVDTYEDTLLMRHLGVDGIFTNAPDVSRRALAADGKALWRV